jgi:polysaccharide biosynthesis/export protein
MPRALLVLLGLLSGCATGRYTAVTLPEEFRARPTENVQTVELARLASPTVQTDVIAKGDVLEISLSSGMPSEQDIKRVVRVDEQGEALLSELGSVKLAGLELESAEAMIATLCVERDLYRTPQVTITTKQAKLSKVTVVGAVAEPDTYELRSGQCNLLAAIVSAGGLAEDAGTIVEIRHPGYRFGESVPRIAGYSTSTSGESEIELANYEESQADASGVAATRDNVVQVDLVKATQEGAGGYDLPDGAIVHVERRDPQPIYVYGLVKKAGEYEYPVGKELRLTSAIALAGDISNPLADKVYVIRNIEGRDEPIVVQLSLKKAKERGTLENLALMPGDTVSVENTLGTTFYETIRIISFGVGGSVF